MPRVPVLSALPVRAADGSVNPLIKRASEIDAENVKRRARTALADYAARSRASLTDPVTGFLAFSGERAADGYEDWAAADRELLRNCGESLGGGERAVYYALAAPLAEEHCALAARHARAEQMRLSLALLERELAELGARTWLLGANLAERMALLEAAVPTAMRAAREKASVLGQGEEAVPGLAAENLRTVLASLLSAGIESDPIAAVPLFDARAGFLNEADAEVLLRRLFDALSLKLASMLADEVGGPGRPEEFSFWLLDDSGLPGDVKSLAASLLRLSREKEALSSRVARIKGELNASRLASANGGDPAGIPLDLWSVLPEESRAFILGGMKRTTDPGEFARLSAIAAKRPEDFAGLDLTLYYDRLSPADFALLTGVKGLIAGNPDAELPRRVAEAAKNAPESSLRDYKTGKRDLPGRVHHLILLKHLTGLGLVDETLARRVADEIASGAGKAGRA